MNREPQSGFSLSCIRAFIAAVLLAHLAPAALVANDSPFRDQYLDDTPFDKIDRTRFVDVRNIEKARGLSKDTTCVWLFAPSDGVIEAIVDSEAPVSHMILYDVSKLSAKGINQLATLKSLRAVCLSSLDGRITKEMLEALSTAKGLTRLELSGLMAFDATGAFAHFRNLRALKLDASRLSPSDTELIDSLERIEALDLALLSEGPLVEALFDALPRFTCLRDLRLTNGDWELTRERADRLKAVPSLDTLIIRDGTKGQHLKPEHLKFHKLKWLGLGGMTRISEQTLTGIGECKDLRGLVVNGCALTDAVLTELCKLEHLQEVYDYQISGLDGERAPERKLTSRGIERLIGKSTMRVLCMPASSSLISDQCIAALKGLSDLEVLDLSAATRFSSAVLANSIPESVKHLNLSGCVNLEDVSFGELLARVRLRVLYMSGSSKLTAKAFANLALQTELRELLPPDGQLAVSVLSQLPRGLKLDYLRLVRTDLGAKADADLAFSRIGAIKTLDLYWVETDAAFSAALKGKNIAQVFFYACASLKPHVLEAMSGNLEGLEQVVLYMCDGISREALDTLRKAFPKVRFSMPTSFSLR